MEKIKIHKLNSSLEEEYDVLICSASFESRTTSIPEKLKRKKIGKVIIVENCIGSDLIKENSQKISEMFGKKAVQLKVDYSDSLSIADEITKAVNSASNKKLNVLVDITTFTHEILLICLKVLLLNNRVQTITCVYINASEYCPGVELKNKWLSQGCENIHSVLGYPGMLLPSQKDHLVVIVGYEYNRAFEMISALEPNSITLVYGEVNEAITEKDREANSVFKQLIEQMAFEFNNIKSVNLPCNNPEKISEGLQELYNQHENDNIIVVPMNNKMSTVGVALSVRNNERVQICYAPAVVYNELNYSSPGKDCYIFKIK